MESQSQREDALSANTLRRQLRHALPARAFSPTPARMLWAVPLVLMATGGWWAILGPLESGWWKLLASLVVVHALGALAFLAHEILHGAMGGPRWLQNGVAWFGLGPILTPPDFWRGWHNRMHHGHTNHKVKDLDHFGTLTRHQKASLANKLLDYAPGSGHPLSYLFCCYSFSLHAQVILWTATSRHPSLKGRSWKKEKLQSIGLVAAWLTLGVYSGWDALYTVIIPFAGANFIIQSYIVTNHWLRPLTTQNRPLDNSLSLVVPKWLDPLHFRFSHHAEHHLLPGLASSQLPKVRQWVLHNTPGELALLDHASALKVLYQTPRTYRSGTELAYLDEPEKVFDLIAFGEYLRRDYESRETMAPERFWRFRPMQPGRTG